MFIEEADLPSLITKAASVANVELSAGLHRLAEKLGTCVIGENGGIARPESIAAEWSRFPELKPLSAGALSLKRTAPSLELSDDDSVFLS